MLAIVKYNWSISYIVSTVLMLLKDVNVLCLNNNDDKMFIKCLLCASHCDKHLLQMQYSLIIAGVNISFRRWEHWSTERLNNLAKATQSSSRAETGSKTNPIGLTLYNIMLYPELTKCTTD